MSPAPVVSVVVPARDAGRTLGATLASLRAQTLTSWEAIVVDDASRDRTAAIARATGDPRIRVVGSPGRGPAAARNAGVAEARCELVAFLDADDLWTPDKLAEQVAALARRPDAVAAYSWTRLVDGGGRPLLDLPPVVHEDDALAALLVQNFIACGSNTLMRRSVLAQIEGPCAADLAHSDDRLLHVELAARGPFAVAPGHHVLYRQRRSSHSRNAARVARESPVLIERMFAAAGPEHAHLRRRSVAERHRYLAWLGVRTGDRRLALRHLSASVRLHPPLARGAEFRALLRHAALSS